MLVSQLEVPVPVGGPISRLEAEGLFDDEEADHASVLLWIAAAFVLSR